MQFKIQVVAVAPDGDEMVHEIASVERDTVKPETLGLSLAEGKAILSSLQTVVVEQQVAAYLEDARRCPACGKSRTSKGQHHLQFRTVFGTVKLPSPRLYHCPCAPHPQRTFSPLAALLPDRTSPELAFLMTKWASLASYGLTSRLLEDVLPLETPLHPEAIRRQVQHVAERVETALGDEQVCFIEGCQHDWDALPIPDGPLTVGLDGGYVRARGKRGWFEVIAGKSVLAFRRDDPDDVGPSAKCFSFVNSGDAKPKRRLFDVLQSQGMQPNQQITFLSDGGDTVRALQMLLSPNAEHILDWFHVAMRLTVMGQYAKRLPIAEPTCTITAPGGRVLDEDDLQSTVMRAAAERDLESIKWRLWHGDVQRAREAIADLAWQCDAAADGCASAKKLAKAVTEFQTYIENNGAFIPNYGERYRNGEAISSAIAESTVNQVVSRRMVKKQQMQWTPQGAHLLLQTRTRVLNDELEGLFRQWYPNFRPQISAGVCAAA
jgi:hypothetical protein